MRQVGTEGSARSAHAGSYALLASAQLVFALGLFGPPAARAAEPAPRSGAPAGHESRSSAPAEQEPKFNVPPAPGPVVPGKGILATGEPQVDLTSPGDSGNVTELAGGIRIWTAPDAQLSVEQPLELALGAARNTLTQQVLLSAGELRVRVPEAAGGVETALLVRTPGRAAFVVQSGRGVAVVHGKNATFAALSGRMLTGVGARWRPLKEGSTLIFSGAAPQGVAGSLPAPPNLSVDHSLATSIGHEAVPFRVHLSGQAPRHRVTLLRRAEGGFEKVSEQETSEADLTLTCPEPGTYWVAAWPIGAQRIAGQVARLQRLVVVGLVVPESNFPETFSPATSTRSITLRPNQSIELLNAEDLEMSYGTPRYFAPAPDRFSLAGEEATSVWLREPGGTETLSLRLVPNILNAAVSIEPRNATWPGKKILARVRFLDGRGRLAHEAARTRVNVSINARPTRATWSKNGDALESWIAQPLFAGPWVIRIEVLDSDNRMLGRNFLEVATTPALEP